MTKSYIDVTGDNEDATPCLFVNFDENRYLFEAGEGTQKIIRDLEAVSLPKVKAIFITSLSWSSIGGLIGLIFALSDAGVEHINMYSPKGLFKVLKASRAFSCVPSLKIHLFELNNHLSHSFKVSNMNTISIPLYKTLPQYKDVKMSRDIIVQNHYNNWDYEQMNPEDDYLETEVDPDAIICYIGSTPDLPGKFHPDKAIKLGVEKGANFSLLNSGQSVISKTTGLQVTTDMVKDPDQPGSKFALIRCPSKEYFNSLFNNNSFEQFYNGQQKLSVVYHLVPEEVILDEQYQQFINKLAFENTNIKHIIVNSENCERYPSFPSSDHYLKKLKALVPPIFQIQDKETNNRKFNKLNLNANVIACEKVTRVYMGPLAKVGVLEVRPYQTDIHDVWEFHHHQESNPEFKTLVEKLSIEIERVENIQDKQQYPKVLFTGTGSAVPSRFRNVTGNYIALAEDKGLLLDAGECTYSQLYRAFGQHRIKDILLGIKMIWISHEHADHHLGVPGICLKRSKYTSEPLVVVGPPRFISWLNKLNHSSPINFIGIPIDEKSEHLDKALEQLEIKSLVSIPVIHCDESVGICIELQNGVRISYSGDTRPCPEFIELCKDSLILIHESSFEDDQLEDAKSKNHSTIGEAIQVGRDMNAKCTLLTHFSQRFCQVQANPPDTIKNTEENPFVSVLDLMYISPYQYSLLPHITNPINLLLSEKKKE